MGSIVKSFSKWDAGEIVLALLGAYLAQYLIPLAARGSYAISAFPLAVALGLYLLYRRSLKTYVEKRATGGISRRKVIVTAVLSIMLSLFLTVGSDIQSMKDGAAGLPTALGFIAALMSSLPIYCLLDMLWDALDRIRPKAVPAKRSALWPFVVFCILLGCWLPYLLASWPGFFCYDVGTARPVEEYYQFQTGEHTTIQPLLHVLLLGCLIQFGEAAWGSVNAGIGLYTVVQSLVIAATLAGMCVWIRRRLPSRLLVYGSVAYFALSPTIGLFVMCSSRDVLFSVACVVFCLFVFDALRGAKEDRTQGSYAGLIISGFLVGALRNNGLVALVLFAVICIVYLLLRRKEKAFIVSLAVMLAFTFLWYVPIYSVVGVEKISTKGESLAVVIQDLGYVYTHGVLTEEEEERLLSDGYHAPFEYRYDITDTSKYTIDDMSKLSLFKEYLLVGLAHPLDYLKAELLRTGDAWNPYSYVTCYNDNPLHGGYLDRETSFFEAGISEPGTSESLFPAFLEVLVDISSFPILQRIPFIALFVSIPFCSWLLLLAFARSIIKADLKTLCMTGFLAIITLSALLGPCVLPRYYLFLFFAVPLLVFALLQGGSSVSDHQDRVPEGRDAVSAS